MLEYQNIEIFLQKSELFTKKNCKKQIKKSLELKGNQEKR